MQGASLVFALLGVVTLGLATPLPKVANFHYPYQCEPVPDPNVIPPGNVNISLSPMFEIFEGTTHEGATVLGQSGVTVDVNIIIITLTATFNIQIPALDVAVQGLVGRGYVDFRPFTSLPGGNFSANNAISNVQINGMVVRGNANLFINLIGNRVSVRDINIIELSFDDVCIDMGDLAIGDAPVDWSDFCSNFKSRWGAEWGNATLRNQLIEKVRGAVNLIVGQYTLDELIDLLPKPCL